MFLSKKKKNKGKKKERERRKRRKIPNLGFLAKGEKNLKRSLSKSRLGYGGKSGTQEKILNFFVNKLYYYYLQVFFQQQKNNI